MENFYSKKVILIIHKQKGNSKTMRNSKHLFTSCMTQLIDLIDAIKSAISFM